MPVSRHARRKATRSGGLSRTLPPMSSARMRRLLGPGEVRNDVPNRVQAVEENLSADDQEGDAEAVLDGEFDKSSHSRGHVGTSGRVSLQVQADRGPVLFRPPETFSARLLVQRWDLCPSPSLSSASRRESAAMRRATARR